MKKLLRLLTLFATASASLAAGLEGLHPPTFRALVSANGVWVAVDGGGQLLVSSNRLDWKLAPGVQANSLHGLAFGSGRFVAVGDEGTLLTSTDGAHWTRGKSDTDDCLRGVAFGNGGFLAAGKCGTLVSSKDGIRWHFAGTSERLQSLAFGHGCFVAVGQSSGDILTSSNGFNWKRRHSGASSRLARVVFENETFVAFDGTQNRLTSTDGRAWVRHSVDTALR